MKCIITLTIGGESIDILVDSSNLPKSYAELKDLMGKENWKVLVDKVDTTLKNRKKITSPNLEKLKKSNHIIPNTTMGALINRFTNIAFPEDTEQFNISDKKVLYVDSYKTEKGELKYGLYTNPNGEEIIIVDRYNIEKVAKYLLTIKAIQADHILNNIDKQIIKELEDILELTKKDIPGISSIEEMLVNFLLNRNKYFPLTHLKNSDVISTYAYLDDIVGKIFNISHRKSYKDITINNISHSLSWNKNFDTASISVDLLFNFLQEELKTKIANAIGIDQLSLETFKEYFSGKFNSALLNSIFGTSKGTPYEILANYLLEKEPEFAMHFKDMLNNRIYFETYFLTLENLYGIGFPELLTQNDPIYHNGRYILQITNKDGISTYYVTKHYTDPHQRALKFDSFLDAKDYIDNNLEEPIVKNSLIDFHKRNQNNDGELITGDNDDTEIKTTKKYNKGTLITVLDYDVPSVPMNLLTSTEAMFVSENYRNLDDSHPYATKEDFFEYVKNDLGFDELSEGYGTIINNINSPEKIALFVLGLNNQNVGEGKPFNKNSGKAILKLARLIGKVKNYRYYYVKSSNGTTTKVVRINNDSKESTLNPPRRAAIQLWHAALLAFIPKLGIDMQILMEPEEGKENKKAYIKGNTVYINILNASSLDLFHEYVHVLMAYLKNNNNYRSKYVELLSLIWELGKDDLRRKEIESIYKDYSMEDKMEEYFVDLFGKWIQNNANQDFSNIFSKSDVLKESSNIFSDKVSITELYGSTVELVFTRLNSDVALFFNTKKPLMDSEYKNLFTASRLKSEWIRLQILNKKLIEYDCVQI